MNTTVDISFEQPRFSAVSRELFEGVKQSYGSSVVEAVSCFSNDFGEEAVKLVNLLLPKMRKVLGRQRRDYGLDPAAFPVKFPAEEQAENVDDCPVCSKVDYRVIKLKTLKVTSKSMILEKAKEEAGQKNAFRSFKQENLARREVDLAWSEKVKEKFKANAEVK